MAYRKKLSIFVLCLLALLVYSNTFSVPLEFDDNNYIVKNVSIRNVFDLSGIYSFWPTRFVAFLTFALNYHWHEFDVVGYHIVNLIIHIGAGILVWWLSLMTFSTPLLKKAAVSRYAPAIAFFVSCIFLVHPLQTESVTYIYQRTTSLAGFLYLFSLCLYIRSKLEEKEKRRVVFYAFSLVSALLGVFTKENVATLPFIILLYEFTFFKTDKTTIGWKRILPFFFIALVIPLFLFLAKPRVFVDVKRLIDEPVTAGWYYFLTQPRVMITYMRLLIFPAGQNLDYDYPILKTISDPSVILSMAVILLIIYAALRLFPKYKIISFAVFYFFITLLPESSLIPLKDVIFEHRLYLPIVGYGLLLVTSLYYLFGEKSQKALMLVLTAAVIIYSILAYNRNAVWRDGFTLWDDTVAKSPYKARPYNNRGVQFVTKQRFDEGIADYNTALLLDPSYGDAYYNRGLAYVFRGDPDKAIGDFNKALELLPRHAFIYSDRGNAYALMGDYDKAISDYTNAIAGEPGNFKAYYNRGMSYFSKGELDRALSDFNAAIKINPDFTPAYGKRAAVYLEMGR